MNDKNDVLIIREFTQDDWRFVKSIYQQGLDSNIATFQTLCPSFDEWNDGHLQDCRFVAVYEEKVIGFAALSPTSKREVYRGVVEVSCVIEENNASIALHEKCGFRKIGFREKIARDRFDH